MRQRFKDNNADHQKLEPERADVPIANLDDTKMPDLPAGTYWLTRVILIRFISFIYLVAFIVAFNQNDALIGKSGLLPADKYLNKISNHVNSDNILDKFILAPTFLWLSEYENDIDWLLSALSCCGMVLSSLILIRGYANFVMMIALWLLYHSLCSVGQRWYSFGWESQLLESGFLAIFLCPIWTLQTFPIGTETPMTVLIALRWLIFRIMVGAGLIKIRGDKCWRDLTCMHYFYETQPVPNPLSYYFHQTPDFCHNIEVLTNHFVELVVPFFIFFPRRLRIISGTIQIIFQCILIITGNLSFLNWLTILPSLSCYDDKAIAWMFSKQTQIEVKQAILKNDIINSKKIVKLGIFKLHLKLRNFLNFSFGCLIAYLSIPIVQNLISSKQIMNTSFDPFRIVNTYGAFGSITKERTEIIFQGTYDSPDSSNVTWLTYEFKCKPGDLKRRPCIISPYHYRLDWLMWFAAFQNYNHNPWLINLAAKLLHNDEKVLSLISFNPFDNKDPPNFIRAEHYRYKFTKIGSKRATAGAWWTRNYIGNYLPPVSLNSLKSYLQQMGWN